MLRTWNCRGIAREPPRGARLANKPNKQRPTRMHASQDVATPDRTAGLTADRSLRADPSERGVESSRNNSWQGWLSAVTSKMSLRNILRLAGAARLAAVFFLRSFYHP